MSAPPGVPRRPASAHTFHPARLPDGGRAVRKALAPRARARDDLAARLRWEGRCLTRLAGRHHVLACHAVDDATPALLLEWAPGGSLADRLRAGPLPAPAVAALAVALGDALAHVHAAGLVHRDVKPSNVLFGDDGAPRLADFGVAAPAGARGSLGAGWEEGPAGTLGYAPPEQLAGAPADPRADVYALGALLWEAATGRPVWALAPGEDEGGLRARVVRGDAPALGGLLGVGPPAVRLAAAVAPALAPDPAARPADAPALAAAVRAALGPPRSA